MKALLRVSHSCVSTAALVKIKYTVEVVNDNSKPKNIPTEKTTKRISQRNLKKSLI